MHAILLRDIRSRFFNHGLGFLIVPLFPLAHIMMLLIVYTILNRAAPFGDDLRLYFATGLIPVITFMYVSRFMSASIIANRSLMAFPVVRLLDIVLARALLELMGMGLSVFMIFNILFWTGSAPYPLDPTQAVLALMTTAVLAIGMGIIVSVICAIVPFFALVYSLSLVILYLSSGGPIYVNALPSQILEIIAWNPAFHICSWMRSAFYIGYPDAYLDKQYLVGWAIGSLVIGLLMERLLRQFILRR